MRYTMLIPVLAVSLAGQGQPNCTGITLDVDVRCACVKDPTSEVCKMVKAGFYEFRGVNNFKRMNPGLSATITRPQGTPVAAPQPARPQQARVVPLAHKDYLRFLQPNAHLIAGFDFEKVFQTPEVMAALFAQEEGQDARSKVMQALKEMDHLWLSIASPSDVVLLMTGKFEQGVAAGMCYAQGIRPVFLGGAHAMMVGPEPSLQAALARLANPAAAGGWVTRRARELSTDHETWIVVEPPPGTDQGAGALQAIRKFSLGIRLTGAGSVDGEAVADSEASAEKIATWVSQMKTVIREKTGVGALDALTVERAGPTLRFAAKGDALLAGDSGKSAVNSDFGVELYRLAMSGFPGMAPRTVASDKLLAVTYGMKREEVLNLLGRPLGVYAIQGLDTPRETWTYQVPSGKQFTVRMDGGVVTIPPR